MDPIGPPWEYIKPSNLYLIGFGSAFIASLFILTLLAFFFNKFFKRRHEVRVARIQSGNLDPMTTQAGAFVMFRRGIILIIIGLNLSLTLLVDGPEPLLFLPFSLGLAYFAIYFIHVNGLVKLFPENGEKKDARVSAKAKSTESE